MNRIQRLVVLIGCCFVAILFHTYFCDWRTGTGNPLLALGKTKVKGKEWKRMVQNEKWTEKNAVLDRHLAEGATVALLQNLNDQMNKINEIKDEEEVEAIYGVYWETGLRPTFAGSQKRTAFYLGVVLPIVIVFFGIVVLLGGLGRPSKRSQILPSNDSP
jgi:hypothetical protein